jgi:hypothetical protein
MSNSHIIFKNLQPTDDSTFDFVNNREKNHQTNCTHTHDVGVIIKVNYILSTSFGSCLFISNMDIFVCILLIFACTIHLAVTQQGFHSIREILNYK